MKRSLSVSHSQYTTGLLLMDLASIFVEIGVPILPRFFLVTTQSGVKSMTLTLDGARERMYSQGHAIVECVAAVWTYKYHNGYTVTLRGPLTAHVVITSPHPPGSTQASQTSPQYLLKFEDFQFDANFHDKYIALESVQGTRIMESPKTPRVQARNPPTPTPNGSASQQQLEDDKKWEEPRVTIERASIPGEPVNAFGIPQATMRCLEVSDRLYMILMSPDVSTAGRKCRSNGRSYFVFK